MAKRALVNERITPQWQVAEAGKTMDEIAGSVRRGCQRCPPATP